MNRDYSRMINTYLNELIVIIYTNEVHISFLQLSHRNFKLNVFDFEAILFV